MSWVTRAISAQRPNRVVEHPSNWIADGFLGSYLSWREACEDVRSAYDRWRRCGPLQRGLAFESYSAALDREEHTARVHSDWAERLRTVEC